MPKATTDILLNAQAHAPYGRPARHVQVSLAVGPFRKVLDVYGERAYYRQDRGIAMAPPVPFATLPIVYERAFGGIDTTDPDPRLHGCDLRNPIGRGFALKATSLVDKLAPNIERQDGGDARLGPAGFGAIASYWSPRIERAGTYDERWHKTRKPLLPEDYDAIFVQCAPDDQRPARPLHGGEVVELVNLSPGGSLRFELPSPELSCTSHFGKRREEHACRLTAVIIEPDAQCLMLVWQTDLLVAQRQVDYLDRTVIQEKRRTT